MNKLMPVISKWVFYVLAVVLVIYTASLNVAFIGRVLPNMPLLKYMALATLDIACVAWLAIFIFHAKGIQQRVISVMASVIDLAGAVIISAAEILTAGQQFVDAGGISTIAIYVISIWVAINIIAVWVFHVSDVEVQKSISIKNAHDKVEDLSLKELDRKIDDIAVEVASKMADKLVNETLISLSMGKYQNGAAEPPKEKNLNPGGYK